MLSLAHRKAIVGRMLFYEAASADELRLRTNVPRQLTQLENLLDSLTARQLDERDNDKPFSAFLLKLAHELVGEAARIEADAKGRRRLLPIVQRFEVGARGYDCVTCARSALGIAEQADGDCPVCSEQDHDHEILARGGRCLKDLRDRFKVLCDVAFSYYSRFGDVREPPNLVFVPGFVQEAPHKLLGAPQIGGRADHHSDRCEIKLLFWLDGFGFPSFYSMLYVLAHEVICHGYFGHSGPPTHRINTSPSSSFCDGWMDFVTVVVLQDWLGHGPLRPTVPPMQPARTHSDLALDFHLKRRNFRRCEEKYVSKWAFGALTAQRLQDFFERLVGPEDGLAAFLRLSLSINAKGTRRPVELDDFVSLVDACLPPEGSSSLESPSFTQAMRSVIESNDFSYLPFLLHGVLHSNGE